MNCSRRFFACWRHFWWNLMDPWCLFLFKCLFWRQRLLNDVFDFLFLRRRCRSSSSFERKTVRTRPRTSNLRTFLLDISCSTWFLNSLLYQFRCNRCLLKSNRNVFVMSKNFCCKLRMINTCHVHWSLSERRSLLIKKCVEWIQNV